MLTGCTVLQNYCKNTLHHRSASKKLVALPPGIVELLVDGVDAAVVGRHRVLIIHRQSLLLDVNTFN
jgi:hypothetical protein